MEVDVYIDGSWRGAVRRGDARTFSTLPGHRTVTVRTHDERLVLYDARVRLDSGRPMQVTVVPPRAKLVLVQDGAAPLLVTVSGA
jgi:hypothetical protein